MQTSHFQLGLIAALAMGLGFTLSSSPAVGYPAGAAVSLGSNPLWSVGGGIDSGTTTTVLTAPADQDWVVSDVIISPDIADLVCDAVLRVRMVLGSGQEVGRFALVIDSYGANTNQLNVLDRVDAHYTGGIIVPAGDHLDIEVSTRVEGYTCNDESLAYALAGYSVQP